MIQELGKKAVEAIKKSIDDHGLAHFTMSADLVTVNSVLIREDDEG